MTTRELQYNRLTEQLGQAVNQQGTLALRQQRAEAALSEIIDIFALTLLNFSEWLESEGLLSEENRESYDGDSEIETHEQLVNAFLDRE